MSTSSTILLYHNAPSAVNAVGAVVLGVYVKYFQLLATISNALPEASVYKFGVAVAAFEPL